MEIATEQSNGRARLRIKGNIDEKGAEALKAEIGRLNLESLSEVAIDLREVKYIGSSGIGKILLLYKHLTAKDGALRVENASANVYELFKELKLDTIFPVTAG
ncbi:MAG: STAS domain-containing protein [Thermodesulfobacteriota bacterium]